MLRHSQAMIPLGSFDTLYRSMPAGSESIHCNRECNDGIEPFPAVIRTSAIPRPHETGPTIREHVLVNGFPSHFR